MAPPKRLRVRTRGGGGGSISSESEDDPGAVKENFDISKWFPSNDEFMHYYTNFSNRKCLTPRLMSCNFFASEGFQFQKMIEDEGLSKFVSLKHSYSPDLVKAFICGLEKGPDGKFHSTLLNRRIDITPTVWMAVTGLNHEGVTIKPKDPTSLDIYDRNAALASFLKDPMGRTSKRISVGLLTHEGRLLHYAIVKIIYPRKGNFAIVLEEDILLMFCFKHRVRINWPWLFSHRLLKCKVEKNVDIPYAVLISAFLDYFKVEVNTPRMPVVREFDSATLAKIRFKKINGVWSNEEGVPICGAVRSDDEIKVELDAVGSQPTQQDPCASSSVPQFTDPFQMYVAQQFGALNLKMDGLKSDIDSLRSDVSQGFTSLDTRFGGQSRDIDVLSIVVDGLKARLPADDNSDAIADF